MSGRIRSIKPEILDDEEAADLSDPAWRLWVSLWVLADDYGNARASARYLAALVWQDTRQAAKVPGLLSELASANRIVRYEVAGQPYAHIRNWEKHQRIDNAGKPKVPDLNDVKALRSDSPRLAAITAEVRGLEGDGPPLFSGKGVGRDMDQPPPRAARGTRMQAEWKPLLETIAGVVAEFGIAPHETDRVLAEFRDYWIGVAGKAGVKLDWEATFRNRLRDRAQAGKIGGHFPKAAAEADRDEAPAAWAGNAPAPAVVDRQTALALLADVRGAR